VREAAADIPADVRKRLDTAARLSGEDREAILRLARQALARFQPRPEATPRSRSPD
jgi:F-type H+-transporting ATPase subunit alpha